MAKSPKSFLRAQLLEQEGLRRLRHRSPSGGSAGDAKQLRERGRSIGEPAGAIDEQAARAGARARVAQRGLARSIVDEPPQAIVDEHQFVDAGAPAIARAAACRATDRAPERLPARQAELLEH